MVDINIDLATWQVAGLFIDYGIKIAAVGIVPEGRRPSSSNAWLLLILLLPIVGLPLFLLMGSPYISRRRHQIQQEANARIEDVHAGIPDEPADIEFSPEISSILRLSRALTGFPAILGHNRGLHADYQVAMQRMADAIDQAQDYVHVEIYITAWDDTTDVFFSALQRAAARGVQVRYLFDQIGSLKYPGYRKLGKRLTSAGIVWWPMLPLAPWRARFRRPDLRNHRKIVVIDGNVGFIGSINMIDRSYLMRRNVRNGLQWVDYMVEFTGPIVASFESMFAVDWYTESNETLGIRPPHDPGGDLGDANVVQLVPSGPGYTTSPNLRVFTSIIHHAKDRLIICSPYFVPDESILEAVTTAAYRGVRVELLVSEKADQFLVHHAQSSYYQSLLESGIRIYQFPAPYVLHSKFILADPDEAGLSAIGAFGSSNLDMRSFGLNYESTVLISEGNLLGQFRDLANNYRSVARELTLERWNQRGWGRRYVDNVAKLTSALQ